MLLKEQQKPLLAKVYLFENDFPDAETYALDVINSGMYTLDPDFGHTFSVDGQFNSESIFEVGAIGLDGSENGGNQYGNTQGVRGSPNKGWGFNRPSVDLMNSFETGDPRKDATIIFLGEVIDGVTILGDGTTPRYSLCRSTHQFHRERDRMLQSKSMDAHQFQ